MSNVVNRSAGFPAPRAAEHPSCTHIPRANPQAIDEPQDADLDEFPNHAAKEEPKCTNSTKNCSREQLQLTV